MILPASKEEGKKLKKRYAVFNEDGSLAELKGFEVKRRGELQLVKIFQSSVFESFLHGSKLDEVYESVATVANYWLDVLYSKAANMPDCELFELICENRSMSRKLEDYGGHKSTSISTAKRLAEFLGDQMVKDKGLSCRFIISRKPEGTPVTDRAIPLAIFQTEDSVKKHYLRRWLKDASLQTFDIREILDWQYYIERLNSCIQKIITIPAALQGVSNPVPRCPHPDWLHKRLLEKNDVFKQKRINEMFAPTAKKDTIGEESGESTSASAASSQVADIEDVGQRGSRPAIIRPTVTKRKFGQLRLGHSDSQKSREGDAQLSKSWKDVLGETPTWGPTKDDKVTWLQFQKKKWEFQAKQRTERKRLRKEAERTGLSSLARRSGPSLGMSSFIRQQAQSLLDSPWQIIQIAETDRPGVFCLWSLIGTDLHAIKVVVPRILYVNCHTAKEGEGTSWRRASRTLPRSHPALHLYEYLVPESVFREHSSKLATDLSSPDIEGIYESQVPLIARALIKLGCVCSVNKTFARLYSGKELDTFELDQLNFKTLAECSYLENASLKSIYMYHSSSDSRSMIGLFFPSSEKAFVFIIDTVRNNQTPNMTNLYQTERAARLAKAEQEQEEFPLPPETFSFEVRVDTSGRQAYRAIQRLLMNYKEEKRGPTMIHVQSAWDISHLTSSVTALQDFPLVFLPYSDGDVQYNLLDWQRHAVKRMVNYYLEEDAVFQCQLENSRYYHIPVGNIPSDPTLFAADLFYSRHLRKHNHLLWMSPTGRPDLGGKEDDENRLGVVTEEGGTVEVNNSGCYPTVCVELSVDGLAVNTVLQSAHINDVEGGAGTGISFDSLPQFSLEEMVQGGTSAASNLSTYDEAALCSTAFRILKGMVHGWLHDVSAYQNQYADVQLMHFYRWLSSPSSLLYDPALCRMIQRMMKKLFMQLVAEFKRLGSTIVFASFSKIIIFTKKRSVTDALAYVQFILKSIQSKDLFLGIDIVPTSCWEYLMWMDQANHGGVRGIIPTDSSEGVERSGEDSDDDDEVVSTPTDTDEPRIEMNWNICKYLPTGAMCQNFFQIVIAGHIHAMYKHSLDERSIIKPGSTPVRRKTSTQAQRVAQTSATPTLVTFAQERIENELMQQLFSITQKIQHTLSGDRSSNKDASAEFPVLPGSHLPLNNPALEFVKYIYKVLSLDSNTRNQVNKLRRDLLRLLGIGEFSFEASFRDPCSSLVLPEVICQYCNLCRDLDLCRDPFITPAEANTPASCKCPNCSKEYDMAAIEHQLISSVQKRSMAYVLQDLKCSKCRGIKDTNLAKYCKCAGGYCNSQPLDEFADRMKTVRNVARHYQMTILKETVEWILRQNPSIC